ncbi:hypothetical protein KFE96_02475 [Kordiimonas sp. SCSIO 12603]|uniref:beta-lactamase hydrolase domain-containing protein n=1 Tax=Kordiimonas sp. SCSIO 12603 TaxID=2829596 RepID=UPI002103E742|nr:sulfur transferase domain-containing protein [Kordiimonas sp. SCSIO 12603]UTW59194.1 hypothetical protein KFE96_02475 [Kordiimonas sp. SCSIO 12603]
MKFLVPLSMLLALIWNSPAVGLQEQQAQTIPKEDALQVPNLQTPIKGLLVGGQPEKMDIAKIKALGFDTIITLRPYTEETTALTYDEKMVVEDLGMTFVRIPIQTEIDLNDRNLALLNQALEAAGGKAFVHCRTGNRVGAMLALRAFKMQKVPFAEAMELGRKAGLNTWTEATEKRLKGEADQ